MQITTTVDGDKTTLAVVGCLDTSASPEFAEELAKVESAKELHLDFSGLEFIASAGLRILVTTKKHRDAAKLGNISISGMNDVVREVFDVTGLDEVFSIK